MTLIIEAINQSYFEITVTEVGVVTKDAWYRRRRFVPLGANLRERRRLESRSSTTFSIGAACHSSSMVTRLFRMGLDNANLLSRTGAGVYFKVITGQRCIGGQEKLLEFAKALEAWAPQHHARIRDEEKDDSPLPASEGPPADAC